MAADLARALASNRVLTERIARLTSGLTLLARIAGLARSGDDVRATACAVLTGVTAGVGLGMNRAVLLIPVANSDGMLEVLAAVGPKDRAEADRVWRQIERDAPDLETLYEAGLRSIAAPSALDATLRGVRVPRADVEGGIVRIRPEGGARFELDRATSMLAPLGGAPERGWLVADCVYTARVPDDDTRFLFRLVASLAGPALEAAARFETTRLEASTDPLTGLASRRTGDAILREIVDAATLEPRSIALLMLDVDDFKKINDAYGHPTGDAVLAEIGRRVRTLLPPRTRAFRYGGEELAVVCDGVDEPLAAELAERLRAGIAERPVVTPRGALAVTVSVGFAVSGAGGASDTLLERADAALLAAKRSGKNRVVGA